MNDITNKMRSAFQNAQGGLFAAVQKADVGDQVVQLMAQGYTLMSWADPFFPDPSTPYHVAKATADAIMDGKSAHYTAPIGNGQLKEKIAEKLKAQNHLEVIPERNILITPGSDSGLFFAMLPFIEAGDEVLIPDPSYPNNKQNVDILNGKAIAVPLSATNNWQFDFDVLESYVTDKTKMLVLTNPNNPTTTVFRRENLEELASFVEKHDLIVVVDQAFEDLVYDDIEMVTFAALPGMWERTVSVFSFSKGMGLSGYRVGYLVTNDKIMDKFFATAVSVIGATNTAAQIGAIAALENHSFVEEYKTVQNKRRTYCYEQLQDIPGIKMLKSESGILSWIDVSDLSDDATMVDYLRDEAKVLVNAGSTYGPSGQGYIRLVHGVLHSDEEFEDAIQRIRRALLNYKQG